jgi:hypothetical protein
MDLDLDQQGPGHPISGKNNDKFQSLKRLSGRRPGVAAAAFSARRQVLPSADMQKRRTLIASREYGLY